MRSRHLVRLLAILAAFAGIRPALATTDITSSFTVSLTITAQCVINSASNLNFGSTQGVITDDLEATSTIAVQCTNTTPYDIGLAVTSPQTPVTRLLTGALSSATLTYGLYRDSDHLLPWGPAIGTNTVHATGNGAEQSYTVYGLLPEVATPEPDTYSQSVTLTVTY